MYATLNDIISQGFTLIGKHRDIMYFHMKVGATDTYLTVKLNDKYRIAYIVGLVNGKIIYGHDAK